MLLAAYCLLLQDEELTLLEVMQKIQRTVADPSRAAGFFGRHVSVRQEGSEPRKQYSRWPVVGSQYSW